ncbi:MAG: fatty acid desaturase [Emcibacteraceae bacterium]|nr:fatty acid desaturase [Emcibacteraceae bacterium]
MFRNSKDRIPVLIILSLSVLDFYVYFTQESILVLIAYWGVFLIPKANICAWNHHHQHNFVFRQKWLNRTLEFFYALHTGAVTNIWVLHHNLGHHRNFLDQKIDESRWKYANGKKIGELAYTFIIAATGYSRAFQVGAKHKTLKRRFVIFGGLTFLIVGALVIYNPVAGLILFVLPMICSLLFTAWTTYDHHAGLDSDNQFEASFNKLNWLYNMVTGNLGYHTAHHYKPGTHWSKLPELHETIKDKIPAHLINNKVTLTH